MKLMIPWKIHPDKRHEVLAGFAAMDLADYESEHGPTIEVLGRWIDVIGGTGVVICETDDAEALALWMVKWNPFCDFEITPVLNAAEAHALARKSIAEG